MSEEKSEGFLFRKLAFLKSFNRQFWVVNALELFERGSYYGFMAVFAYHVVYNLGYQSWVAGFLLTILMPLLYFVPLISSALAEKYGYRSVLIVSFSLLLTSYFTLSFVPNLAVLFAAVVGLGVGAGAFKPIISSTIAHIVPVNDRNYAYAIYYWMINLGAFTIPLTIGLLIPTHLYRFVFLLSTILISLNLVVTLTLFKDPVEKKRDKNVFEALLNLNVILKDKRFAILLLIYSLFWFMFAVNHSFLPLYMVDFRIMPSWFTPPLLATINPLTIVIIGPFLPKFYSHVDSKKLMITGILLFTCSLFLVGMTITPALFVIGIILFSFGEFITHPSFISYVSKIAPKDKVAIYMGFAFLPAAVGLTMGIFVSSFLYPYFAETLHRPKVFWAVVSSMGLLCVSLLVIYNRHYTLKDRKEGREEVPLRRKEKKGWKHRLSTTVFETKALLVVAVILAFAFNFTAWELGTNVYYRGLKEETNLPFSEWPSEKKSMDFSGELKEGGEREFNFARPENRYVRGVEAELFWKDEPDIQRIRTLQNEGDTFSLRVSPEGSSPISKSEKNEYHKPGSIDISYYLEKDKVLTTNKWTVLVKLEDAGDYSPGLGGGLVGESDTGNTYTLTVILYLVSPPPVAD